MRLQGIGSAAEASQNSNFTFFFFFLWESPGFLLGLCSLLSLPYFTTLSHCSIATEETYLIYE